MGTANWLGLPWRRPDIVARGCSSSGRQAHRSAEGRLLSERQFVGFHRRSIVGHRQSVQSGSSIGSAGAAISLPIFNSGRLRGQLRGAHAEYDAAVSTYNATISNALHEVADAVTSRKSLDGELAASSAAVGAAAEAHRIVSARYKGELATYLDVLTAEDQLISAQRGLAEIETRSMVLDVALVRSLGGGFQSPDEPSKPGTPE
jgi:outer membrane protein TolC